MVDLEFYRVVAELLLAHGHLATLHSGHHGHRGYYLPQSEHIMHYLLIEDGIVDKVVHIVEGSVGAVLDAVIEEIDKLFGVRLAQQLKALADDVRILDEMRFVDIHENRQNHDSEFCHVALDVFVVLQHTLLVGDVGIEVHSHHIFNEGVEAKRVKQFELFLLLHVNHIILSYDRVVYFQALHEQQPVQNLPDEEPYAGLSFQSFFDDVSEFEAQFVLSLLLLFLHEKSEPLDVVVLRLFKLVNEQFDSGYVLIVVGGVESYHDVEGFLIKETNKLVLSDVRVGVLELELILPLRVALEEFGGLRISHY